MLPVTRIIFLAACSLRLTAHTEIIAIDGKGNNGRAGDYWQQELHYEIRVSLNDKDHKLRGFENIRYVNHSQDTLHYIWFHLWPNAYKNRYTAFYEQITALGTITGRQKSNNENGYIDSLHFTVDGQEAKTEEDPKYIDILKIILPERLLPGENITVSTPFRVKIPPYFSRLGYEESTYLISQWYPKPAVYDRKGWHPFPYLDQGEFYSEFGSFDVRITLPASYIVGATGILQTGSELDQYKEIGHLNLMEKTEPHRYRPDSLASTKTLEYRADSVHDFAWFADKNFIINYDTLQLVSGRTIDVFSYYRQGDRNWESSISFIKDAVRHYSAWIGEYLYPVVSAVEGPWNANAGGMEYPMITLISSSESRHAEQLDIVIAHEVGHNWFYGILGTNEREHPWMDEGVNTYYEFRYEAEKYRNNSTVGIQSGPGASNSDPDEIQAKVYNRINQLNTDMAIENPSTAFNSDGEYGEVVYEKTALWMYLMERSIRREKLDQGMKAYFRDWKFKHPYPEDMELSMEQELGTDLKNWFALLNWKGRFD
jgi:hypothetical protein